jgi:sulfite reductase alpha subunit
MGKHNTPMLDELEKGPWPSFVSDIKQQAEKGKHVLKEAPNDFLGVMELSFQDRVTHWKHGGIVGVFGYGGGIIGRYCDQPQKFPGVAHFHTIRVN